MILSADKLVFVALEKKPLEIPVAIPSKKGPPSKFSTGNYDLLWSIPSIHLEFFVFLTRSNLFLLVFRLRSMEIMNIVPLDFLTI